MTVGQGPNLIRATFTTTFYLMLEGNIAFVIVIFSFLTPSIWFSNSHKYRMASSNKMLKNSDLNKRNSVWRAAKRIQSNHCKISLYKVEYLSFWRIFWIFQTKNTHVCYSYYLKKGTFLNPHSDIQCFFQQLVVLYLHWANNSFYKM